MHCFHDTVAPHHMDKSGLCWMPGHHQEHSSSRHESDVSCTPVHRGVERSTWMPHNPCQLYIWHLDEGNAGYFRLSRIESLHSFMFKINNKKKKKRGLLCLLSQSYLLVRWECCGDTSQTCSWVRGHTGHPSDSSGPPLEEEHKDQSVDHRRNPAHRPCHGRIQPGKKEVENVRTLQRLLLKNYPNLSPVCS